MPDIPHLALPLALGPGGALATIEQDSPDDVVQCVAVLLRTPIGSRVEVPEYGVPDLTFTTDLDGTTILEAIGEWEPRADVDLETLIGIPGDELTARVLARVRTP